MASLFAGTPQEAPSYAATTSDVPKWLQDYTVDLFSQQRAVSGTPYQPYELPRIAQQTAPTTAAYDLIQKNIGAYQPAVQNAITGTQGLAGQTAVSNIGTYMNPYTQNVTDQIAKLGARNLSENLLPAVSDQFIKAGQFGSSGMGTFGNRALRDTQESILANQASALQSGYTQALGASQADLTRQQGALAQTADLAKAQQGLSTADAAALQSIGAEQQAQQQKGLDVGYQDFLAQRNFPQEQINAMSTTLRGLPANATPTTSTQSGYTTQFTPSTLGQIAGAYSLFQGINSSANPLTTKAEGGVVNGYANGGAVTGGEDLHGSVMADYGKYFKRGGEVEGYAYGGTATAQPGMFGVGNKSIPELEQYIADLKNNKVMPGAVQGQGVSAFGMRGMFSKLMPQLMIQVAQKELDNRLAAGAPTSTADHYTQTTSAPNVALAAPVSMPADIDELNAKYYQGGDPYGKYLGQGYSHGGMVPGYAEEGYVDAEDPAPMVDGGQAFADQYAQGQLEYPTQQDAPVMAAPTMSYMQDPEVIKANLERKELLKQLQTSLANAPAGRDTGPTESEMWFNRAAAFLDPGKTGSFGEGLQHLSAVEAAHKAEQRKAKIANQAADLQRLQARSELAQKQYEMTMDEGKRRLIEQYLTPKPTSTDGGKVGGYDTGVPDNMKALLLSQEPADAVKTLVEMAKENNKPSDLIRGVKFLVGNNSLTPAQGDAIIQENLQGKLEMVDVAVPELGGTFKLTGPEARTFYSSGELPKRFAQTAAPAAPAGAPAGAPVQAAPKQLPLSQEQMKAKETGLVEQSKADIAASGDLLAQKSFAKQQKDAANLVLGYATKSPKSFGILADPTFSNALASLVDTGVNTPWGSVGLAVEEPIAKLKLTGPEASVRQLAAAPIALIEVGYRKMFLKGEGAVSNMEGALTKFIGPQLSDNAKTVQLKAGMITIGAEKQEKIVDAFEKYKEQHPEAGPRSFYQTPEYKRINDSYENKYRAFAEKNGIPVAASSTGGSLAERIRQDRANRQNKEGK
jgi:hypothetical protein